MATQYGQGLVSAIRAAFPDVKEPPTIGTEAGSEAGSNGVAKQP